MPDNDLDPAASTQMFQAFVDRGRTEEVAGPSVLPRVLAGVGAIVVLLLLAIVALKLLG